MRTLLVFIGISWSVGLLAGDGGFVLSTKVRQAWEKQFLFDFESSQRLLGDAEKSETDNRLIEFLKAQELFFKVLLFDHPGDLLEFRLRFQQALNALESGDSKSAFYHFCLSEFYLHAALVYTREAEHLSAARALKKAFAHNARNRSAHPEFLLQQKTHAVLEALGSAVPASYRWIADLAGIQGNAQHAFLSLKTLRNKLKQQPEFHFIQPELYFIETFLSTQLAEQEAALVSEPEQAAHPLVCLSQMLQAQKQRNALAVLSAYIRYRNADGKSFPYLHYLQAEALQNTGKNAESFNYFLMSSKGNWFRASAMRRLAWEALLNGNPAGYDQKMSAIADLETFPSDEDRQARKEALSKRRPSPELLRVRLFSDGGMYSEALRILENSGLALRDEYDSTEWVYRKGRVLQGLSRNEEALRCFDETIEKGKGLNEYFAASAALQAGLIVKSFNPALARTYWRKVSRFPDHPYKKSLDAKAEAFLRL